jgi:hypothetical protein
MPGLKGDKRVMMAGHLEEKQPQAITSPDDKLQTLHHRMSVNRFGHRVVDGVVKNIGSDSGVSVEIKAEYYDAAGTLIGTEVDIVRRLEPGKTAAFQVVYSGERRWDIKHYKIVALRVLAL